MPRGRSLRSANLYRSDTAVELDNQRIDLRSRRFRVGVRDLRAASATPGATVWKTGSHSRPGPLLELGDSAVL